MSRLGIDFSALDGEPVHVCFLLVLPDREEFRKEKKIWLQDIHGWLAGAFAGQRLIKASNVSEAHEILSLLASDMVTAG